MKNTYSVEKLHMAETIKNRSMKNMGGIKHTTDT